MTPELWQQVKDVLDKALDRSGSEREAYLDDACAGQPELRAEVESLLSNHEDAGEFIEQPIVNAKAIITGSGGERVPAPERIGSYRITGLIGEGGMGAVYRAVRADDQYQKTVAIKVLKRGMDTSFIIDRFRIERQILASLDHPNIAHMYDGGTTEDGLPFFVMEYIEGVPLVEFCNQNRLGLAERLEIFRKVCAAVQYAHQNLIVHRDLKPGNILVAADGTPKLLDFGIAKLLTPDSSPAQTVTLVRMMTPEYASPEQIRGEPINTTSDVYSLGVILYELLTGRRPYHLASRSPHEVAQIVCEIDPTRPSTAVNTTEEIRNSEGKVEYTLTPELISYDRDSRPDRLRRALSGDLDNIVMMAMRKDRNRRYVSAGQLGEDIRRHLNEQPVIAQPDTFQYRAGKFISRHRAAVVFATLGVLALTGGLIGTIWQYRQASIQRARAERRFNDVRRLANSVVFEIHDAIAKLPGSTPARELIVLRALNYLDALSQEATNDPALQSELAAAYLRVAEVQGSPGQPNLGQTAQAVANSEKARGLAERLTERYPQNVNYQINLATIYDNLARLERTNGHLDHALGIDERMLALRQKIFDGDPKDVRNLRQLAISYFELAGDYVAKSDYKKALEIRQKSVSIFEQVDARGSTRQSRANVALGYKTLAGVQARLKDNAGALESLSHAVKIEEALHSEDPNDATVEMALSYSYSDTGYNLIRLNRNPEAADWYRKALAIRDRMARMDPKDVRARNAVATTHDRLGNVLANLGRADEALREGRAGLAIREQMATQFPKNMDFKRDLSVSYGTMGDTYITLAKLPGMGPMRLPLWHNAREWYVRAYDSAIEIEKTLPKDGTYSDRGEMLRKIIAECDDAIKNHGISTVPLQ